MSSWFGSHPKSVNLTTRTAKQPQMMNCFLGKRRDVAGKQYSCLLYMYSCRCLRILQLNNMNSMLKVIPETIWLSSHHQWPSLTWKIQVSLRQTLTALTAHLASVLMHMCKRDLNAVAAQKWCKISTLTGTAATSKSSFCFLWSSDYTVCSFVPPLCRKHKGKANPW